LERWRASRANRRQGRWLIAAAVALASIAGPLAAVPAGAAVTLGQLPAAPPPASSDCASADFLQPSITGGNLYIARQAGTITSWATNSSGGGATYVFKVFRRTSDPDVFQVIARASPRVLTAGLNTVPVNIAVRPGDMIGINVSAGPSSCTFLQPGDAVLTRAGALSEGASGPFAPLNDVRLNLSAVLNPTNAFTVRAIARDRKQGTATVMVDVSNPGLVTISGKGLNKRRASKVVAVARTVQFKIAAVGSRKRRLERTGKVTLAPTMTFFPIGGDPASTAFTVKLKRKGRLVRSAARKVRVPPAS
jgi:hypothetical protein